MPCRQLDLFDDAGDRSDPVAAVPEGRPRPAAADLDDTALIAAIPWASLADCRALAAEAGRRRLAAAVPALEVLCRRFLGFGRGSPIPEQEAALAALAEIGGSDAAAAAARLIEGQAVQGPGLAAAVVAAAGLGVRLGGETALSLLRDPAPRTRAAACRCVRPSPAVTPMLLALLEDIDREVARAAACGLGRAGRGEARPVLLRLLREAPSAEVIDAAIAVADEECLVLFGRLARTRPDLAEAALAALDAIPSPRAATIAAAARRRREGLASSG
jgi:HEAT repeats